MSAMCGHISLLVDGQRDQQEQNEEFKKEGLKEFTKD
jgi:hypothetical protein